jgi:hypothetical protein
MGKRATGDVKDRGTQKGKRGRRQINIPGMKPSTFFRSISYGPILIGSKLLPKNECFTGLYP